MRMEPTRLAISETARLIRNVSRTSKNKTMPDPPPSDRPLLCAN